MAADEVARIVHAPKPRRRREPKPALAVGPIVRLARGRRVPLQTEAAPDLARADAADRLFRRLAGKDS